ncbi:MAG: HD domain-containing protein [Anaerolineales bacterium]|nr:HD domain-containing protein [Anaerolineales bacterium]
MPTIEQARTWHTNADPVHDFDHVLRVHNLAVYIAGIEGADLEIVRAAALLHDAKGAAPGEAGRLKHHLASAEFAGEVLANQAWSPEKIAAVQHCIRAHRFRGGEKPTSLEARILFDADKLDVLGAIGAARVIAYASLAGTPWYAPPSTTFLQTGKEEPGEPHSAYHEHLFKLRRVVERLHTQTARSLANARLAYLDGYFEQLIAEWNGVR